MSGYIYVIPEVVEYDVALDERADGFDEDEERDDAAGREQLDGERGVDLADEGVTQHLVREVACHEPHRSWQTELIVTVTVTVASPTAIQ